MANAIARVQEVNTSERGPVILLYVIYSGADVGTVIPANIDIPLVGTESAVELRTLMSTAVSTWPGQNGFTWTVAGTAMLLPTFQKG